MTCASCTGEAVSEQLAPSTNKTWQQVYYDERRKCRPLSALVNVYAITCSLQKSYNTIVEDERID